MMTMIRTQVLVISLILSQTPLLWPTALVSPAHAFGKHSKDAEETEPAAKKEKKEKKEKELTPEEIEEEKAYMEHQAKLVTLLKEVKTPFGSQGAVEDQARPDPGAPMTLPATPPLSIKIISARSPGNRTPGRVYD